GHKGPRLPRRSSGLDESDARPRPINRTQWRLDFAMQNLTPTNRLLLILTLTAVSLIMGTTSVLAADVALMWDPSSSSALSGYKLYYGTGSRSYGTVKS